MSVLPSAQKEAERNPRTKFYNSLLEIGEALDGVKA